MATLYGVTVSPYVRKVMLAHEYKGVNYKLKLTPPGSSEASFSAASPLKKIPAYETDQGIGFADSTVIIAYLERISQQNKLYPENADLYAKALWLEEYCDTKMSEATTGLYYQLIIGPRVFEHVTDEKRVNELREKHIPKVFSYIESQLAADEWIIDNTFSIADLSIGMNLMSLYHTDYVIDAAKFPKLNAFNKRFMALDIVVAQLAQEKSAFVHLANK